ncbi:MAG: signal peptidase I [Clostridia bacterium]|nr:signal peptidase I [Clostridia bacterium]
MKKMHNENKSKHFLGQTKTEKTVSIIAIVFVLILVPILVLNCVLILKSAIHPDKVPALGKHVPLIVLTESMECEILDGDLIVVKITDTDDIEIGQVISYFDPESKNQSVVTHRIIDKYEEDGDVFFRTQGDNNDIEDRLPVPAENVIGVWTGFQLHYIGFVMLGMQTPWGLIICIAVPVIAFLVIWLVRKHITDAKNHSDMEALKAELDALKAEKADKGAQNPESEN